jgi:alkyldihydroxyacetonephosphate synthase
MGYAVDTLETAIDWANVPSLISTVESALRCALQDLDKRVYVFTHLSHIYPSGSSIYTTVLFPIGVDPDETLQHWKILKAAASEAIIKSGATISHHHGIGEDHRAYLPHEKGPLGMAVMTDICRRFDPTGIMNPRKLIKECDADHDDS